MKKLSGSLRHMRRSISPPFWPIHRKGYAWAVKPIPGPHPAFKSIPIGVILRDMLKYASSMREARIILNKRQVEIDGRLVTNYKFPVGVMDVIHIIPSDEYFRMIPHPVKFLTLHRISKDEADIKLLRIKRKTMIKGGILQLTFHDGRNKLITDTKTDEGEKITYKTYDTVKFSLSSKEILDHYKFKEGNLAIVFDGSNVGFLGKIKSIRRIFKTSRAIVTLESPKGLIARTILEYVFVIGRDKPEISLPEEVFGNV